MMKANGSRVSLCSLALLALPLLASAAPPEFSGSVGGELRGFFESPAYDSQFETWQPSFIFEPEVVWQSEDRVHQLVLAPFLRVDAEDSERSHFDIREAYWLGVADQGELLVGIDKVFWGVSESRHLVDIINQTDGVEDLDGEDKLGQPMVRMSGFFDWGNVALYALPYFRERNFVGSDGRLRPPIAIDADAALYESRDKEWHTDVALRYSRVLGEVDLGISYFYGTSREPRIVPGDGGASLVPFYDLIHQVGFDGQWTHEGWLWKSEAIVREGHPGSAFFAGSGGVEYTLYQIGGTDGDLGLLAEVHYDDRPSSAPATFFDEDAFVGARWAANDTQDTSVLAGAIVDLDGGAVVGTVEAARRIGDSWKLEVEARILSSTDDETLLSGVGDDSFASLRLTYFW